MIGRGPSQKKLDEQDVAYWHKKYRTLELNCERIAKILGVTSFSVRKWFRRHGLKTNLHLDKKGFPARVSRDDALAMHKRYMAGERLGNIAADHRLSHLSLRHVFKRYGLEVFRQGRNPNTTRAGERNLPAKKANPPRYSGDSHRVGDWAPVEAPHSCITVDRVCLLCHRMQA